MSRTLEDAPVFLDRRSVENAVPGRGSEEFDFFLIKGSLQEKKSMSSFKSLEIIQTDGKTTIVFKGKEQGRDDFLGEFYTIFLSIFKVKGESFYKPLLYLFKEAVKNIYDHGTGKATLIMTETLESFSFEFIDENPVLVKFTDVNGNENWVKKSEHNFGVGLQSIIRICKTCNITLKIDDTKGGIHYYGLWPKPISY